MHASHLSIIAPAPEARREAERRAHSRVAAEGAVADWLQSQAGIVALWRDLLVEADGDYALVAALDAHAAFLREASRDKAT